MEKTFSNNNNNNNNNLRNDLHTTDYRAYRHKQTDEISVQ